MGEAEQIIVNGLEELLKQMEQLKDKRVFVFFVGAVDPDTCESWCPDCVKAEPIIEEGLSKLPEGSVFVMCFVGDRATWKDPNNEFRTNTSTSLTAVPTIIDWGKSRRLVDSECFSQDKVNEFFSGN